MNHLKEERPFFKESEVRKIRETAQEIESHEGDSRQWILFCRRKVKHCLNEWQDCSGDTANIYVDQQLTKRIQVISTFLNNLSETLESTENVRNEDRLGITVRLIKAKIRKFLEVFQLEQDIDTRSEIPSLGAADVFLDPRPTRRYDKERISPSEEEINRILEEL